MKFASTFIFLVMATTGVLYTIFQLVPNGFAQFFLIIGFFAALVEMSRK